MSVVGRQNIGLLVAVAVILLIGGFVAFRLGTGSTAVSPRAPSPASAPAGSSFAHSMSNAKQLALANLIYAVDYDDRFPPAMDDFVAWQAATMPYIKNTSVFYSANPRAAHFIGNGALSTVPGNEINDPQATVLLLEDREWPDGRRIVGYADGHVKAVTGFDMATGLTVDLTPKGISMVEESKKSSLAPMPKADKKNPLGMPGN